MSRTDPPRFGDVSARVFAEGEWTVMWLALSDDGWAVLVLAAPVHLNRVGTLSLNHDPTNARWDWLDVSSR